MSLISLQEVRCSWGPFLGERARDSCRWANVSRADWRQGHLLPPSFLIYLTICLYTYLFLPSGGSIGGCYGKVYRGRCRGKEVAIKKFHKQDFNDSVIREFQKEVDNWIEKMRYAFIKKTSTLLVIYSDVFMNRIVGMHICNVFIFIYYMCLYLCMSKSIYTYVCVRLCYRFKSVCGCRTQMCFSLWVPVLRYILSSLSLPLSFPYPPPPPSSILLFPLLVLLLLLYLLMSSYSPNILHMMRGSVESFGEWRERRERESCWERELAREKFWEIKIEDAGEVVAVPVVVVVGYCISRYLDQPIPSWNNAWRGSCLSLCVYSFWSFSTLPLCPFSHPTC